MAKSKFPYVDKWISNTQINQKIYQSLMEKQRRDRRPNHSNSNKLDTHNTWVTAERISSGPSHTKTPIAHYAHVMTWTHGPISYQHVNTHT